MLALALDELLDAQAARGGWGRRQGRWRAGAGPVGWERGGDSARAAEGGRGRA